jgi:benzoylformate decarboxylase
MGVDAVRVEKPEEIEPAIDRMFSDNRPFLIDLVLEADIHPNQVAVDCGS